MCLPGAASSRSSLALSVWTLFILKLLIGLSIPVGSEKETNYPVRPIPTFGEERLFPGNSELAKQRLVNGKAVERGQWCYLR